jgi:hypothetical protein
LTTEIDDINKQIELLQQKRDQKRSERGNIAAKVCLSLLLLFKNPQRQQLFFLDYYNE